MIGIPKLKGANLLHEKHEFIKLLWKPCFATSLHFYSNNHGKLHYMVLFSIIAFM